MADVVNDIYYKDEKKVIRKTRVGGGERDPIEIWEDVKAVLPLLQKKMLDKNFLGTCMIKTQGNGKSVHTREKCSFSGKFDWNFRKHFHR